MFTKTKLFEESESKIDDLYVDMLDYHCPIWRINYVEKEIEFDLHLFP